jgi:RNase P subunit RPR2
LNSAISTKERLQKLGLEKTATLAEFIENYELLGFNVEEVQRLAGWRKGLTKLGINPDGLEGFIDEKGPLEVQRSKLNRDVEALRMEVNMLEKRKKALLNETSSLSTVSLILKTGKATLPCKRCNWLVPVALGNKFSYQTMIEKGLGLNVWCPRCGWQNWFDPREVMASIGWIILPT